MNPILFVWLRNCCNNCLLIKWICFGQLPCWHLARGLLVQTCGHWSGVAVGKSEVVEPRGVVDSRATDASSRESQHSPVMSYLLSSLFPHSFPLLLLLLLLSYAAYIHSNQIMGWGEKAIEIRSVETGHLDGVFMHKRAQRLKFLSERNDKAS